MDKLSRSRYKQKVWACSKRSSVSMRDYDSRVATILSIESILSTVATQMTIVAQVPGVRAAAKTVL
jgi:hypothetical protein